MFSEGVQINQQNCTFGCREWQCGQKTDEQTPREAGRWSVRFVTASSRLLIGAGGPLVACHQPVASSYVLRLK